MPLTDAEIIELETLLKIEGLAVIDDETNRNFALLQNYITSQKYSAEGELLDGKRGAGLEGSSRSGKTWSSVDIIIYICLHIETNCVINIVKETYNEFKTTLYNDFKQRMEYFGLPHPFDNQEVKSFRIGKNKINFIGADKANKFHGAQCDYLWLNEPLGIIKAVFDQAEMRCKKFWWFDYNPSVTEHFIFNSILTRPDIGFLRTTFLDNPKLSIQERNKILSYEPWLPGSYQVLDNLIMYRGKEVGKDNYPPPHPNNIDNGTADEFMWKVYGLGLRGSMRGVIFPLINWIDEFPSHISHIHANDFGFTTDPNALVKYAEDTTNIYIELLSYEPIETPDALASYFDTIGIDKKLPLPCDSADKYTGQQGTVEMVTGLRKLGYFNAFKISKTKTVMFWLNSMKTKRIHIVRNHLYKHAKVEAENYRIREINGTPINEPLDQFNHMWDAARYGHIAYNNPAHTHTTSKSLSELGIDF